MGTPNFPRIEAMLQELERKAGVRGGMFIRQQRKDGSWPKLPKDLSEDCVIVERLSFGHDRVSVSAPPHYRSDGHPAARADFRQQREAMITGRQINVDPEKLS
jgi:hypothetical protein